MPPADAGLPPAQQQQQQPPQGHPQMPPAGQQPPPPQSDDTQRLIIGAQSPQSEPPRPMMPGYESAQQPMSPEQQMQQPGMYPGSAPGAYPGQVPPGQMPPGAMGPGGQYPPPAKKSKKWLVPVLVIAAVLIIGGAAAGAWLYFQPPSFEEGGCVRHTGGDTAEAIECDEAVEGEDYEITSKVDDGQECADAGRETLTVGEDVYCLTLIGAEDEGGEEPTAETEGE